MYIVYSISIYLYIYKCDCTPQSTICPEANNFKCHDWKHDLGDQSYRLWIDPASWSYREHTFGFMADSQNTAGNSSYWHVLFGKALKVKHPQHKRTLKGKSGQYSTHLIPNETFVDWPPSCETSSCDETKHGWNPQTCTVSLGPSRCCHKVVPHNAT